MKYMNFCIDYEGLLNNHLNVYTRVTELVNGQPVTRLKPADWNNLVITDVQLNTAEQLNGDKTLDNGDNITPKQLHNIVFFEMLKAFRR